MKNKNDSSKNSQPIDRGINLNPRLQWMLFGCLGVILIWSGLCHGYDRFSYQDYNPRLSVIGQGSGALVGAQERAQALFGNPAFLTDLRALTFSFGSGLLAGNHISSTAALAQPIPLAGKLGLGLSTLYSNQPDAEDLFQAQEQILYVAYSYDFFSWFSVGTKFRSIRIETPAVTSSGEALDLGVKLKYDQYWLGIWASNLLQPAIESKLEQVAYPRVVVADLGASWLGICRTMVEFSQTFGDESVNRIAWGIESDFSDLLTIRAGTDVNSVSAGLGSKMDRWAVDYAARYHLDDQSLAHHVGLSLHFGAYQIGLVPSSSFLSKGGRNNVLRIRINSHRDKVFRQWTFKVLNKQGQLVYRRTGKNLLPGEIRWEGRSLRRRMVADGDYWMFIEGSDIEGNRLESNQVKVRVVTRRTTNFIRVK